MRDRKHEGALDGRPVASDNDLALPVPTTHPQGDIALLTYANRREPHQAAIEVLRQYEGLIWLELPRFSAKWLRSYRPLWLLQPVERKHRITRLLEQLGVLGRRYVQVAHFDADALVLTLYRHHQRMEDAAQEIAVALEVEVKVVCAQPAPPQAAPAWG